MARKSSIGKAEGDVLRYIAEQGGATVGEVAEYLATTRGLTRTTALSMMERLRTKGFLQRDNSEGVYRYTATEPKSTILESFVQEFVDGVLGGSVSPLVAYLSKRTVVDPDEFAALQKLVRELEEGQK